MIVGLGIDIIEISRVKAAIERNGERFISRVFTANERAYCEARRPNVTHYAGRFAAKEAALRLRGRSRSDMGTRARCICGGPAGRWQRHGQ